MSGPTSTNFAQKVQAFFRETVITSFLEVANLSPLMVVVGSACFSLIAMNLSLLVLSFSSVEALALFNLVTQASDFFATPESIDKVKPGEIEPACKSSFSTFNEYRFRFFLSRGTLEDPLVKPLYFLAFLGTYASIALSQFSEEFSRLGSNYQGRPIVGAISAVLFIALYLLFLYMFGCANLSSLFFSVLAGALVGFLVVYQNLFLLGKSVLNLSFVPEFVKRTQDSVCVITNAQ